MRRILLEFPDVTPVEGARLDALLRDGAEIYRTSREHGFMAEIVNRTLWPAPELEASPEQVMAIVLWSVGRPR